MEEKMKKVLFLWLFLLILGAANVNSQVRIGGNGVPNGAAILDLNATDAINNGTKGLALPRVSLSSNTVQITSGTANLSGMLVYNTNTTLGAGVYYWDTNKWVKVSSGEFVEGDGIIGNEVVNATIKGGLKRYGSGTSGDPWTLGLDTGASVYSVMVKTSNGWNTGNVFDFTRIYVGPRILGLAVGNAWDTTSVVRVHPDRCLYQLEGTDAAYYSVFAYNGAARIVRQRSGGASATWLHALCF